MVAAAVLVVATFIIFGSSASATAIYYKDIPLDDDVQTYLYNRCQSEGISFDFMLALME